MVMRHCLVTNKSFWKFVKLFLITKSCHTQNDMMLTDNGKVIAEQSDLVEAFNDHYINIMEKLTRQKTLKFCFGNKFTGR